MVSSVKSFYRVWRVGQGDSTLVGEIEADDYLAAVQAAEHRYGADVQVYLPPTSELQTHAANSVRISRS